MAASPQALQEALSLLRQGRLAQAEAQLQAMLLAASDDPASRHLLGIVLLESGRADAAVEQFDIALRLAPGLGMAHYNRGNALSQLQRHADAVASFDRALALMPGMAEACFNRGNALRALGRADEAMASFRQAAALQPGLFQAHNNLGTLLRERGQSLAALASFEKVLAINPGHVEAINNRGMVLHDLQRHAEALVAFDVALALAPGLADAHRNRGLVLQELGRADEAIASYDRAIALRPDALAHNNRGIAMHAARRIAEALEDYEQAITIDPGFAEAWNNRGNALHDLRRMDEALRSYERAIELQPGFPEAIVNRGMVRQDLRQLDLARADYDQAIALRPGYGEAFKRRASLRLLQGDFAGGWADFEANAERVRPSSNGANGIPWWRGQSLAGRSILLSEPNGFGDTLQFIRFVPMLIEQGAQVSFMGPPGFFRLLDAFSDRLRFVTSPDGGRYDFQCLLWSLPHYLGIDAEGLRKGAPIPYLRAEPSLVERWSGAIAPDRFNIGICWQGNPTRKIDAGRSIPLAAFLPLAQVPGVRLLSLQKHFGLDQIATLPGGMQVDVLEDGFDEGADAFVDSAALLQHLDLVVAADTSITHLAGALGRPAWLALAAVPDWRWMLDRADSPWYPSVRLFRQERLDDWSSVGMAMATALREQLAARGARPAGGAGA